MGKCLSSLPTSIVVILEMHSEWEWHGIALIFWGDNGMNCFALDEIKFTPINYQKRPIYYGSGIKRALDGTAHRDAVAIKHELEVELSLSLPEYTQFYKKYILNTQHIFVDDEGCSYLVMFNDDFGLSQREQGEEIWYNGTLRFVEV